MITKSYEDLEAGDWVINGSNRYCDYQEGEICRVIRDTTTSGSLRIIRFEQYGSGQDYNTYNTNHTSLAYKGEIEFLADNNWMKEGAIAVATKDYAGLKTGTTVELTDPQGTCCWYVKDTTMTSYGAPYNKGLRPATPTEVEAYHKSKPFIFDGGKIDERIGEITEEMWKPGTFVEVEGELKGIHQIETYAISGVIGITLKGIRRSLDVHLMDLPARWKPGYKWHKTHPKLDPKNWIVGDYLEVIDSKNVSYYPHEVVRVTFANSTGLNTNSITSNSVWRYNKDSNLKNRLRWISEREAKTLTQVATKSPFDLGVTSATYANLTDSIGTTINSVVAEESFQKSQDLQDPVLIQMSKRSRKLVVVTNIKI